MQERVVTLNRFLHELVQHAESSAAEMRTPSHVTSPRLPAAVLADVAFVKEPASLAGVARPHYEEDAADDSDVSSSPNSSESDDDWSTSSSSSSDFPRRKVPNTRRNSSQVATSARRAPRRRESEVGMRVQTLNSHDSPAKVRGGRPRSHTLAVPTAAVRSLRRPTISQAPTDLRQHRDEMRSAEPLVVLGRSLRDLQAAADELDRDAAVVVCKQEGVDARINEVLARVNEVQQKIDREDFQRVRVPRLPLRRSRVAQIECADHRVSRLRSSAYSRTTTSASEPRSRGHRLRSTFFGPACPTCSSSCSGSVGSSSPSSGRSAPSFCSHLPPSAGSCSSDRSACPLLFQCLSCPCQTIIEVLFLYHSWLPTMRHDETGPRERLGYLYTLRTSKPDGLPADRRRRDSLAGTA